MVNDGQAVRKQLVLQVERANLEVPRNFFSIRAAKSWNELPETVKAQTSINGLKTAYDTWAQSTTTTTEKMRCEMDEPRREEDRIEQ